MYSFMEKQKVHPTKSMHSQEILCQSVPCNFSIFLFLCKSSFWFSNIFLGSLIPFTFLLTSQNFFNFYLLWESLPAVAGISAFYHPSFYHSETFLLTAFRSEKVQWKEFITMCSTYRKWSQGNCIMLARWWSAKKLFLHCLGQ